MVHTVTRRHPRRPPAASEHSSTRVHGCSRTASSSKSKCLHKGQQHRAARKLNFLLRDGRTSAAWRRLLAAQHGKQATRQTGDKAIEKRGQKKEGRSEEHTSELQSLMRISYAVFCLKKKKTTNNILAY